MAETRTWTGDNSAELKAWCGKVTLSRPDGDVVTDRWYGPEDTQGVGACLWVDPDLLVRVPVGRTLTVDGGAWSTGEAP